MEQDEEQKELVEQAARKQIEFHPVNPVIEEEV